MKNIDKFYEDTYSIESPYFKKDKPKDILVASDIHFHEHVDKELYNLLIIHAREANPDYIIMPGDLVETSDFLNIKKERDFFESMIRSLAEIAPVIIIPGNHDIGNFAIDNFDKRTTNTKENIEAVKFYDSLNRIKNVYFLNNEQVELGGMMFLGFSPKLKTYLKKDDKTADIFMEDYLKSGLKMAEGCYNVLLTHSPVFLDNKRVVESISDFSDLTDLVISGHMHDGYMPKFMDRFIGDTNFGIFMTPFAAPIPGILCRGVHDFGRGYIFVSQGFRKWTADIGLFNAFEKITANDIERLIISNSKNGDKNYKKF